jgi:hypothetical protein
MQCPNCHFNNAPNARFCKNCGHSLAAAPALPPSYPPAAPQQQPGAAPPIQQSLPPAYSPGPPPSPQPAGPPPFSQAPPQVFGPPPSPVSQLPQQGPSVVGAWGSPAAQPYAPVTSVRQVRRISPKSAFKVAAGIYGLIYGVIGLFGFLFSVIGALFGMGILFDLGLPMGSSIAGILLALLLYILGTLLVALIAGVSAAIGAFIYNVVAGRIGGIEVEVA